MAYYQEDHEVISKSTGEILTKEYEEKHKREYERRKKTAEYFSEQDAKRAAHKDSLLAEHTKALDGFIWTNFTPLKTFKEKYEGLKESHYARLMYMSTFLIHDSEQIKTDNARPIKKKEIAGLIAASDRATRDFIRDVKKYGLLSIDDDNNVYLHELFTKGRMKPGRGYTHTRMFRRTIRQLYEMVDGRGAKKLGVIFNVIPFIDFRINILCHNADEMVKDSSELVIMTLEELADKLGYADSRRLKDTLYSFKIDGNRLIHITKDQNDKSIIMVNPKFVYAGDYEDFKGNIELLAGFDTMTTTGLHFSNKRLSDVETEDKTNEN